MGTTTETRITSTQAKDAIYKAHSISSSVNEIDNGVLKDKQSVVSGLYNIGTTIGLNKFPKDLVTKQVGSLTSAGLYSATGTSYVSGFFEIKASQVYAISGGSSWDTQAICFYDSSFIFISKISNTYEGTFTSPTNAKYMRISLGSSAWEECSLTENSYFNTNIIPFTNSISENNLGNAVLSSDKYISKMKFSTNLIDKSIGYTLNGMINNTNGKIRIDIGWPYSTTDYQPFDYGGKTISVGKLGFSVYFSEYTVDKKFIKQTTMYDNSYVVDINTKFIRLTYGLTNGLHNLDNLIIVFGSIKPYALYNSKLSILGSEIEERVYLEQELSIPSTMYGLQGKQLNIYHNHLLKENKRADNYITIDAFNWNSEYSRNVWGTTQINKVCVSNLYDRTFVLQYTKNFNLNIGSSTLSTGNIDCLVLGDSYTSPATYVKRIKDLVPNFTSLGTCRGHSSLSPMLYTEGKAGWTLKQFLEVIHSPIEWSGFSPFMQPSGVYKYYGCTKDVIATLAASANSMYDKYIEIGFNATTGLKNSPSVNDCMYVFADSAYKYWNGTTWTVITEASLSFIFNFTKYRSVWNIAQPNYFIVNLGINDFATLYPTEVLTKWNLYFKSYLDTVIASVKADNSNCKIGICIPNNKFGDIPAASNQNFISRKDRAMFEARKLFITNYDNRVAEKIYLLDPCSAIDSVYGMGNITTNVPFEEYTGAANTLISSDPIHPNGYGYNAMAIPIAGWIQATR